MKIKLLILLFVVLSLLFTAACSKTKLSEEKNVEKEESEEPETQISDVFEEPDEEIAPPPAPPV